MEQDELLRFRSYLRKLERQVVRSLKEQTSCCGVTMAQCHVLLEIGEHETIGNSELSGRLGLDPSTLSRTVDGLVQAGLLERRQDPGDRRACLLLLTARGVEIIREIDSHCNRFYAEILKEVPREKQDLLLQALACLVDVLGAKTECLSRKATLNSISRLKNEN